MEGDCYYFAILIMFFKVESMKFKFFWTFYFYFQVQLFKLFETLTLMWIITMTLVFNSVYYMCGFKLSFSYCDAFNFYVFLRVKLVGTKISRFFGKRVEAHVNNMVQKVLLILYMKSMLFLLNIACQIWTNRSVTRTFL
jgi:hypothetical protein